MLLEMRDAEMQFVLSHRQVKKVFSHLNLQVQQGEILAILGPSGCGKSTLLKLMAGLHSLTGGQLLVHSSKTPLRIGFVFQEPTLLPWRTVAENILLPAQLQGIPLNTLQQRLNEILQTVRLDKFAHYYPGQLSGGMKMRVNFARALLLNPDLILMDEPFSALDENTRNDLQVDFCHLIKKNGSTAVFVTHAMSEAVFVSDRICIMDHSGRLVAEKKMDLPKDRNESLKQSSEYLNNVQQITQIFRQLVLR